MNKELNKEIEERVARAIALFEEGYNCSQSVVMAYSDLYGVDAEMAAKLSASFGGGMGRLREVCGAVSGMFLLLGFRYPATDPTDKGAKSRNYEAVQRTAAHFKQDMGSYICADLLKIKREPQEATPSDRTKRYYEMRPCTRCVAHAAEIVGEELLGKEEK